MAKLGQQAGLSQVGLRGKHRSGADRHVFEVPFEPTAPPIGAQKYVTVGHSMFGGAGMTLLRRSPGNSSRLPKLNKLDIISRNGQDTDNAVVKWTQEDFMHRSASVPSIGQDMGGVPFPPSNVDKKPMLANLVGGRLAQSSICSSKSESLARALPGNDIAFPPLLDTCGRTTAAIYRNNMDYDAASGVVGSNYTPTAQMLTIDTQAIDNVSALRWKRLKTNCRLAGPKVVPEKAVDWCSQWPTILDGSLLLEEIQNAGYTKQEFCRTLSRYQYYKSTGIASDVIAPFNVQWLSHAMFLLDLGNASRWQGLTQNQQELTIEKVRSEILEDYSLALKTSIVNYALLDAHCRDRLDIPFVPDMLPEWGAQPFTVPDIGTGGGPPEQWCAGLAAARASLASVCVQHSRTALRLRDFWEKECESVKILAVPEMYCAPLDIASFDTLQDSYLNSGIQKLSEAWQEIVQIVSEEPIYLRSQADSATRVHSEAKSSNSRRHVHPGDSMKDVKAKFFEAVAQQLSNLTRTLIQKELQGYVDFFERFAKTPLHHEEVKVLTDTDSWQNYFLCNRLVLSQNGKDVCFKHNLDKVSQQLLQRYKQCIKCLQHLMRPDAHLGCAGDRTRLWEVHEHELHINAGYQHIKQIIDSNLLNAHKALELYESFLFLFEEGQRVASFIRDPCNDRKAYAEYIEHLRNTVEKLDEACLPVLRLQMMCVDCTQVTQRLRQCAIDCIESLLTSVATRNQDRCFALIKQFEHLNERVMYTPVNEHQLVEIENTLESIKCSELQRLLNEYKDIKAWLFFTWDMHYTLVGDDYSAIYAVSKWLNFDATIRNREESLRDDRDRIEANLVDKRTQFVDDLRRFLQEVNKFKDKGSMRMLEDYIDQLTCLRMHLSQHEAYMRDFQQKERLLGWDATEFDTLQQASDLLGIYEELWRLAADHKDAYQKWMKTSLTDGDVDPTQIEQDVEDIWHSASKLLSHLSKDGSSKSATVVNKIQSDLKSFKEVMPLLHAFCNKALQTRHWQEISSIIGFPVMTQQKLTLQRALDLDLAHYTQEIVEISDGASVERSLEVNLENQKNEWNATMIQFEDCDTGGFFMLSKHSIDEVQRLLDDHTSKTQTLTASPYATHFSDQMETWETFLTKVQGVVNVLLMVQPVWMDLKLTFHVGHQQCMTREAELFEEVDSTLQEIMKKSAANPVALNVFNQGSLLDNLQEAHHKLEVVQLGLKAS